MTKRERFVFAAVVAFPGVLACVAISRMDRRLKALEATQAIQEEPILYRCPDGVLRYIPMPLANQYAREENARLVNTAIATPTPVSATKPASATRDRYAPPR